MDAKTGIALLQQQVKGAKQLLEKRHINPDQHTAWNNATREYLAKIYGMNSPNIETVISAPGNTPVWMGMADTVLERYKASSLENKITMLEFCILSLKVQISEGAKDGGTQ